MLEDAVYYSRREADERALALGTDDPRVQKVHLLLADKYSQLARREMAEIETAEAGDPRSISAELSLSTKRAFPGTR